MCLLVGFVWVLSVLSVLECVFECVLSGLC